MVLFKYDYKKKVRNHILRKIFDCNCLTRT